MSRITCMDCGKQAQRCGGQAKRCLPCSSLPRPRLAQPGRQRGGHLRTLRVGDLTACIDCLALLPAKSGRRGPLRCEDCGRSRYRAMSTIQNRAAGIVARAIRAGALASPRSRVCTDCGRPAEAYDHRDYTQPLKVDPVCRSCNVMRGPADVWPDGFDPRPRALIGQPGAPEVAQADPATAPKVAA